jgi:hypothetical protein
MCWFLAAVDQVGFPAAAVAVLAHTYLLQMCFYHLDHKL